MKLLALLPGLAFADAPLAPDARGSVVQDRAFDIEHLRLDVVLLPEAHAVEGVATYRLTRLSPGPLVLHGVDLDIRGVTAGGAPLPWRTVGDTIEVELGTASEVTLSWRAEPRNGLHFRDARGPGTYPEVWTQGEGRDNRYWFPGWDHPNDRFTWDGTVKAPPGWTVVTNAGTEVVNYLVMIAASPGWEEHRDPTGAVYVPKGTDPSAVTRVLAPVAPMMEHFGRRTGVPWPWSPYRQVFVQQFMYTGMENTTATIMERQLVDGPSIAGTRGAMIDNVVAHELAHQWYGDLLTCRDWRQMWLNEGFATFMAADWQAARGSAYTWADAVRRWYKASQDGAPMAGSFHQPGSADSVNVYNKGASTLQMLRVLLGEETFWSGIRRYTTTHRNGLVETPDLRRALEDVSGRELGWFFQQWVELPGVPALDVSHAWADGRLTVTVRQTLDATHPRYTLPITVSARFPDGEKRVTGWLDDGELNLVLTGQEPPSYVSFDPDGGVLSRLTQRQSDAEWESQLLQGSPYARLVAAAALAETKSSGALSSVLSDGAAPRELRRVAAESLGAQRATEALLPHVSVQDDALRESVVRALGSSISPDAAKALEAAARDDRAPDVRAAALSALGRVAPSRAAVVARSILRGTPKREDVRLVESAANVLAREGTPADLERLLSASGPDRAFVAARSAAVAVVGRIASDSERLVAATRVARAVEPLLDDTDLRVRRACIGLLAEVGDERTVSILEAFRRSDTVDDTRSAALDAISTIRARASVPLRAPNERDAELEALRTRLDALEAEVHKELP